MLFTAMSDKDILDTVRNAALRANVTVEEAITSERDRICVSVRTDTDKYEDNFKFIDELEDVFSNKKNIDGSPNTEGPVYGEEMIPIILIYTKEQADGISTDKRILECNGLVYLCKDGVWQEKN